ncbi:MAG: host attachment protein [Porphyrobacter sp.]|nr:host attachment protein [Porphyrobacter sp.]
MKIPHQTLVALANGEQFVLMRNVGQAFEPKLEREQELDLELTNFSAGIRHQDRRGPPNNSTNLDELAHGAAIAEWLNAKALNGELEKLVIAADPRTLGQIRQRCHKEVQSLIIGEVAKDLINSPIQEVERVLASAP